MKVINSKPKFLYYNQDKKKKQNTNEKKKKNKWKIDDGRDNQKYLLRIHLLEKQNDQQRAKKMTKKS